MAHLNFPDDAVCSTPGCPNKPTHQFSMRMRRMDSGADWAPNHPAFFCTPCATDGARVTVLYEPTQTGHVEATLIASRLVMERTTRITKRGGVPI